MIIELISITVFSGVLMKSNKLIILSLFFISILSVYGNAKDIPHVMVDSLSGRAEVQRAGRQNWELVKQGTKLFDNDIIRALDKSHARLKWKNGSMIFVHSNSQILINLHTDSVNNTFLQRATVFFGAVYFVVQKILPREVSSIYETKVYTPTAILAIRGTSFSVNVDKKSGTTTAGITNGTVLVQNILQQESLYLEAGYQTTIAMNAPPIKPAPLLEKDIKILKEWVGTKVVVDEMRKQLEKSKRDHNIITGKLDERIVFIPFVNATEYMGDWDISKKITEYLANKITETYRIKCTILDTLVENHVELGEEKKSRYVLYGDLTKFKVTQRAEISAAADRYNEYSVASICAHMRLVDVTQKKIIYDNILCGEVARKNREENRWEALSKLKFDKEDQEFRNSLMGEILNETLESFSGTLAKYMGLQ